MIDADPLIRLKDIHLPPPIGWWPLAPGWYVLMVLFLLLVLIIACSFYQRLHRALAKNQALVLLDNYQKQYKTNPNVALISAGISELVRRVALVYYPREQVASLYGEDWLKFLSETSKGIDFDSIKEMLLDAPFKAEQTISLEPLFHAARIWIKQRGRRV